LKATYPSFDKSVPETNSSAVLSWDGNDANFRTRFNDSCFVFSHFLAGHSLFSVPALLKLAKTVALRPGDFYSDSGDVHVDQKWGQIPVTELSAEEVIERIEHAGAWIIMKHVELDPAYAAILSQCAQQIRDLAGPKMGRHLLNPEMLIIANSPGRITPFHMDGECNFLLQVQGSKVIRVFSQHDRTVLTEEEIERFYTNDIFAANYKKACGDERANVIELTPGAAVHIPVNAPHWVQNGPGVSVSISVNFELPDWMRADLYRSNSLIRRLGMTPTPPGRSRFRDMMKRSIYGQMRRLRRFAR
jgi:hypothetical protein